MILSIIKNELFKIRKQKIPFIIAAIMIFLVVLRVIILSSEAGITLNGQTLPIVVVIMDITQYIPLFMVIFIAEIFTEDYRGGTLKLSLIRPVTRFELLLAKFLSLGVIMLIINSIMVLSAYIAGTITGGWGSCLSIPASLMKEVGYSSQLQLSTVFGILATIGSMILETIVQLGFAAVLMLLALSINTMTGTIGIGIFLYAAFLVSKQLLAGLIPFFLISSTYDICLLPLGVMDVTSVLIKLLSAAAYIILFFCAGLALFKKKDLLM